MSEITLIFTFEGKQEKINSSIEAYFREPAKKFALSKEKKVSRLDFVYNSLNIHLNKKVKEICKDKMEIEILVSDKPFKRNYLKYKIIDRKEKLRIFGELFVKNNKNNFKIVLTNEEEKDIDEYYDLKKYPVNLKNNIVEFRFKQIKDDVTNLSMMFQDCKNLISISDFSLLETDKVTDMSYMFSNCSSLSTLPDISVWNTENVTNMSNMFNGCSALQELPDISYWNTENVTNMSYLFNDCTALKSVPDISKWNVSKLTNISNIFSGGLILESFPDISKWNKILYNKGKAKENEAKIECIYLSKDNYFFSCKNCKNPPEVLLKDDQTILLKCNNCCILETEKIEKIRNFQSSWLSKMTMKPCNKHNEVEAVQYCTKCSTYFCVDCLKEHEENNKGHPLTDPTKMMYSLCSNHGNNFTHFCVDCKKEICSKCLGEHKKHKTKKSSEITMQEIIDDDIEKKEKEMIEKLEKESKEKEKKNEKKSEKSEKKSQKSEKKNKGKKVKKTKVKEKEKEKEKKEEDKDETIWYGEKDKEKGTEIKDNKSESKKKEEEKEKEIEKEKMNEANAIILSASLFEEFFAKAEANRQKKDEIIKNTLLSLKVYEEIDSNCKKFFINSSKEFNKVVENDTNFLILSKILFFTYKQLQNFQLDLISSLNYALNLVVSKINEETFNNFKDFMNLKKNEYSLCLRKFTEKEAQKLQANIDLLLAPVHKSLSDFDKNQLFVSKNIESSKIIQKNIAIEKMLEPDKFINIDDAYKDPKIISKILNSKEDSHIILSLLGKILQKFNIKVICKNKDEKFKKIELASLNSLLNLGNQKKYSIFLDYNEEQYKEIINNVASKESIKNKLKNKIANKLKISKKEIVVNELEPYNDFDDTKNVLKMTFTIPNNSKDFSKELKELTEEEENIQKRVTINRALELIELSPELLDPKGDKQKNWGSNKKRGGIRYDPPGEGWYGLGINILDKYENNDWLKSDSKDGEFAVGYLSLNNLLSNQTKIINLPYKLFEDESIENNNYYQFNTNIRAKGGKCEKCGPKCGEGIGVFQNFNYAENTASVLDISGYKVKMILMCRVNPKKIRKPCPHLWVLNPTPDEIRPYRILIKVYPSSPLVNTRENKEGNEIITGNYTSTQSPEEQKSDDIPFVKRFKTNKKIEDISMFNGQRLSDDFFVIRLYEEYYKYINEYLRTEKILKDYPKPIWDIDGESEDYPFVFNLNELSSCISSLQLALSRVKNVNDDTIVYRGVGNKKFAKDIKIGSKFSFKEFISTSLEKSEVEKFKDEGGTLMIITIKNNGTNGHPNYCFNINDISSYNTEKEVIISAHCNYSVTNIQHKDKVDYVYLTCEGVPLKEKKGEAKEEVKSLNKN